MRSSLLVFTVFSLLFLACRKDPVFISEVPASVDTISMPPALELCKTDTTAVSLNDTVVSNPYLAAYPGSWWQYSDGNYVSCELVKYGIIDPQVQQQTPNHYCIHYNVDSVYLPRLNGYQSWSHTDPVVYENQFLRKMNTLQGSYKCMPPQNFDFTNGSKQIDDVYEWSSVTYACDFASRSIHYVDTLTLPNGVLYDEVIHITEEYNYYLNPGYETVVFDYFYNLDIGLIWQIESGSFSSSPVDRYLVSCSIAPH